MNYLRLKHIAVVFTAAGGVAAVIGAYLGAPVAIVVGGLTSALAGLARYLFGAADDRQREKEQQGDGSSGEIAMPSPTTPSGTHEEIDNAAKHIANGRPDVAIDALESIRRRGWDRLTSRERYRLVANLGNAKLAQQKPLEAAQDFIRAVEYQPLDEEARTYEALGYLMLGDRGMARTRALKICSEHPGLGRAHMVRIRTEPEDLPFDALLESVPIAIRNHSEVALALYERACAEDRLAEAEEIIRSADISQWPALALALGSVILKQEMSRVQLNLEGAMIANHERVSEAARWFTQALETLPAGDADTFKLYLNRGMCHRIQGDREHAREDLRRAYDLAPDNEEVNLTLARAAFHDQNIGEGIEVLRRHLGRHASLESEIMLALFLRERDARGDIEEAEAIFLQVAQRTREQEAGQRTEVIEALVDIYISTDRGNEALRLVQGSTSEGLGEACRRALEGRILLSLHREVEAVSMADAARAALGEHPDKGSSRYVALLLERLGRFDLAFELWRGTTAPDIVAVETLHLLRCAKEASEDIFIMEFCARLRANKLFNRHVLAYEVDALLEYREYSRTREAVLDYLQAKPGDKIVRLNLSALALQQGWDDLVVTALDRMPAVSELSSAEVGERVVSVLRFGSSPLLALDYAYDLYRKFPDEPAANRALVAALLLPYREQLEIPEPIVVGEGVAVCYKQVDSDEVGWLVVEDQDPSVTRREYDSSHALVRALLGKKVGDEFELPGSRVRQRVATVMRLQDKRVYRANEVMRDWAIRFPDDYFVESIPVGLEPTPESLSDIASIVASFGERIERLEEAYRAGRIPVATFALLAKKTVFETMGYIAAKPALEIAACVGVRDELEEALSSLSRAEVVLLDSTSIATLVLLDEVQVLRLLPLRFMVTEGALQEIRQIIQERSPTWQEGGYLSSEGGRLILQEINREEAAEYVERLNRVLRELQEVCEVIGGGDLARMDPADRTRMLKYAKRDSIEAFAAAHSRNAILWTDDQLLHSLYDDELPTARAWTQAVFMWGSNEGLLERDLTSHVTARLLRFGYKFTGSSAVTVLDTCEAARWESTEPDLVAVLQDFGNPVWDYPTALGMTAESLKGIWQLAPTEEHARAVTTRLLTYLARRDDHPVIVRTIKESVNSLLGLGTVRAPALREVLEVFLHTGIAPL